MLDPEQVSLVRKSLSVKGKKSKYLTLFSNLLTAKRWTNRLEDKVRKAGLEKADHYYIARSTVLERIVGVLAGQVQVTKPRLESIKVAFHLEAFTYAEKALIGELESAQDKRQYTYMLELFYYVKELKDIYEIQVSLPDHLLSEEIVKENQARGSELLDILQRIRGAKYLDHLQQKQLAMSLEERIQGWAPEYLPNPIDWMRIRTWCKLTAMDLEGALLIQEELVEEYLKPEIPFVNRLKERERLMTIKLKLGQQADAERILWGLKTLKPDSPLETRIHRKYLIQNAILFSFSTYNPEAIQNAWDTLLAWREVIPRKKQPVLILSCVQLFHATRQYKEAKLALEALDDLKRSEWSHLKWQVALFRLLIHVELNTGDLIESLARSAETMARQSDLKYPALAVSAVKYMGMNAVLPDAVREKYLTEFGKYMLVPAEERASHFFNLETFLLSKQTGSSIAEIETSRNQGGETNQESYA